MFVMRTDVKVLRHHDNKNDLWRIRHENKFTNYQNGQSWDVFGTAKIVISFISERNKYAKFVGVWEVRSKSIDKNGHYRYRTIEMNGFNDLKERMIVKWGEGTRSWAQWLHREGNKEIVEVLPINYIMDFPGYYDFSLSYDQLSSMVNNPESNREWQRMLSSVFGIYIILDKRTGNQYIGSAYGKNGIWGRWRNYVKNPNGGNIELAELLKKHPSGYKNFQFSILRVLESGSTKNDVISQEVIVKNKLGSRAFGLNSN